MRNKKTCPNCQQEILNSKNNYCSETCHAKSIRGKWIRQIHPYSNFGQLGKSGWGNIIDSSCVICGASFKKLTSRKNLTCSRPCFQKRKYNWEAKKLLQDPNFRKRIAKKYYLKKKKYNGQLSRGN